MEFKTDNCYCCIFLQQSLLPPFAAEKLFSSSYLWLPNAASLMVPRLLVHVHRSVDTLMRRETVLSGLPRYQKRKKEEKRRRKEKEKT